jgi:hypothetical protein
VSRASREGLFSSHRAGFEVRIYRLCSEFIAVCSKWRKDYSVATAADEDFVIHATQAYSPWVSGELFRSQSSMKDTMKDNEKGERDRRRLDFELIT